MKETLSFVLLKCLNCGANLKISESIFEFACQYCNASQIVQRDGGIVALKFISDKIDRVQLSVDKSVVELKIQRLNKEFEELEKKHKKLDEATIQMRNLINSLFTSVTSVFTISFLILAIYISSIIFIFIGILAFSLIVWYWRWKNSGINTDFQISSKPMFEKGIAIKKEISELEKIINY